MPIEALLKINYSTQNNNISELVQLFRQVGWRLQDKDNKITYLPLNDDDCFNWTRETIQEGDLLEIISQKQACKEVVGLVLYWDRSDIGISVLFESYNRILISLDINRKTMIPGNSRSTTDINWYVEHIIISLKNLGCDIESYQFEEF